MCVMQQLAKSRQLCPASPRYPICIKDARKCSSYQVHTSPRWHTSRVQAASAPEYVSVRSAVQAHATALAGIDEKSRAAGWSAQVFIDTLDSSLNTLMVAEQAQDSGSAAPLVVGFCCMRVVAGEAQLENMAVLPELQGKGVGRKLLTHVLQACGCTMAGVVCYLEVRAGNTAAVKLYTSLGFKVDGRRKGFYADGEDALLMTRPPGSLDVAGSVAQ